MKREQFSITSTAGHNVIKYAWNSARREVHSLMQAWVNEQAKNELLHILEYELVRKESEKQGFYYVSGVMTWKEKTSGKEISFFITKIA